MLTRLFPTTLVVATLLTAPLAAVHAADPAASDELAAPTITVYKSPTCGCCTAWADYMGEQGFDVSTIDRQDLNSIKQEHGLSDPRLASCHTAIVDGYVIEGHVPAADVRQLLAEKPDIIGLTAPGMPMNSPGMASETPQGYDVLSFDDDGKVEVYSRY